jgi:hypothetical protein
MDQKKWKETDGVPAVSQVQENIATANGVIAVTLPGAFSCQKVTLCCDSRYCGRSHPGEKI